MLTVVEPLFAGAISELEIVIAKMHKEDYKG